MVLWPQTIIEIDRWIHNTQAVLVGSLRIYVLHRVSHMLAFPTKNMQFPVLYTSRQVVRISCSTIDSLIH